MDDKAEAKTAKGQVGEDGLFLRLAHDLTSCVVSAELECQGELGRLHVLFDLLGGKIISVDTDTQQLSENLTS